MEKHDLPADHFETDIGAVEHRLQHPAEAFIFKKKGNFGLPARLFDRPFFKKIGRIGHPDARLLGQFVERGRDRQAAALKIDRAVEEVLGEHKIGLQQPESEQKAVFFY